VNVYSMDGFLDAEACRRVQRAMDRGLPETAEVLSEIIEVKDRVRDASSIDVDAAILDFVEQSLDAHRSALNAFFSTSLGPREGAGFLRYQPGGFYRRHRDHAIVASWPGAARRRIAVVVFLNSCREVDASDGAFTGGSLRLLPEIDEGKTIDILPRAGTLVAFPATRLHEVTVVHRGTRDTVVDWFY